MKPVPPGRRCAFTETDQPWDKFEPPPGDAQWQLWDWRIFTKTVQYDHEGIPSTFEPEPFLCCLWVEVEKRPSKPPHDPGRPKPPPTKPAGDPVDVGTRPRPVDGPKRSW